MAFDLYPEGSTGTSLARQETSSLYVGRGGEIDLREEFERFLYGHGNEIAKGQLGILRRARRDDDNNLIACPCTQGITNEPDKDTFCPYCLTGDSLIVVEGLKYKTIKDLLPGERVLSKDGTYRLVADKQQRFADKILSFKSRLRCDPLKMTKDHRMFVIKREDFDARKMMVSEVEAGQIKEGDLFLMPKSRDFFDFSELKVVWADYSPDSRSPSKLPDKILITDEFLWMIGLYVAEGSTHGGREIQFSLHINEKNYAKRIEAVFTELFPGLKVAHKEKPEVNTRLVFVYNSALARWLREQCGEGCENKHFPYNLASLPPERAMKLVEGLWDGDGCIVQKDKDRTGTRASIGVTAREVAYQAQNIMWHNGVYAGLSTYKTTDRRRVYSLEWTLENQGMPPRQFYEFDGFWASAVTEIEEESCLSVPVYDITVEGNHSFVANHTLSHNCWGEGYLWDEEWITYYKAVVGRVSDKSRDQATRAGVYQEPIAYFYTEYSVEPTLYDKIIEVKRDVEGEISLPIERTANFNIASLEPFRSDNGRIEYWRIATSEVFVKARWDR